MKIALIQTDLAWEKVSDNLSQISVLLDSLDPDTDMVLLPEMFATGFSMQPELLNLFGSQQALDWLIEKAQRHQAAFVGSIAVAEGGRFYNRLYFVFPDGAFRYYDKRHLFALAGEDKIYTKGINRLIVLYKGWRICPLICYDLRFPVFSRNNNKTYDLLLYVANWPHKRITAWDILLRARAVENMSYVLGVNRLGEDTNHNSYTGHSQVIDFLGEYLIEPQVEKGLFYVTLDKEKQDLARKKLGFLNDADLFEINN